MDAKRVHILSTEMEAVLTAPDPVALVERLRNGAKSGLQDGQEPVVDDILNEAAALIQSQAARIAELEEGLKPFAQAAAARDGQPDWSPTDTLVIYLRQARSLVSEKDK